MPTTLYSRQLGESTEDVIMPVSSAMLGPHASRMLSAKGLSFAGDIDEQTAVIIQAQYVWPGQIR